MLVKLKHKHRCLASLFLKHKCMSVCKVGPQFSEKCHWAAFNTPVGMYRTGSLDLSFTLSEVLSFTGRDDKMIYPCNWKLTSQAGRECCFWVRKSTCLSFVPEKWANTDRGGGANHGQIWSHLKSISCTEWWNQVQSIQFKYISVSRGVFRTDFKAPF